jgi:hypothetical protein
VRSRHGLLLVPAGASEAAHAGDAVVEAPAPGDGSAYDRVLDTIAREFGSATAHLVATQLQDRGAAPPADVATPRARYLPVALLLVTVGAGSGLMVRRRWRTRRDRRAARATEPQRRTRHA